MSGVTMHGEMRKIVEHLRSNYEQGVTRPYQWRMEQLQGFKRMLDENGR